VLKAVDVSDLSDIEHARREMNWRENRHDHLIIPQVKPFNAEPKADSFSNN
jgi:hypothetical protein